MSRKQLSQVVLWTAVAVWTMLALFLTLQNGIDTAKTSNKIAREVYHLLVRCGIAVRYSKLHQVLRIGAHFALFCIFGILLEAAILASSQRPSIFKSCIPKKLKYMSLFSCYLPHIMKVIYKMYDLKTGTSKKYLVNEE